MQISTDAVDLPTGVHLPYAESGDRDGIPVVLLHGLSDSHRSYEPILSLLPSHIRAFALTQRGHGDSSGARSFTVDDLAADVACFIDAMGLESAIVAGHSMGSVVAQRVAIEYPHYVDGLVVMGGATTFLNAGLEELDEAVSEMTDPVDPEFIRDFQLSTLAAPIPSDYLDMVCAESEKLTAEAWKRLMADTLLLDFSRELRHIAAPTQLLWGSADFIPRSEQMGMLDLIEGSELTVYDGAGHAFHWEQPGRFSLQLTTFAESVAQADGRAHRQQRAA